LNIEVPLRTRLTRDLMLIGEIIQSHSLHIFFLSLPDFLGYSSAMDMVDNDGEEVKRGFALKGFGYRLMEIISARIINGENPIQGGFGAHPAQKPLVEIKESAEKLVSDAEKIVELFASFDNLSYVEYDTTFTALNPPDGKYGFVSNSRLISTDEERSVEEYKEVIQERVVPYSFVKRSRYNGESFISGAIARINLLGERASEIQIFSQSTFLPCRIPTHKVPFELLSALLGKEGKTSYLLGIQPSTLDFDSKISDEVKKSLEKVVEIFTPFFNHSERG